MTRKEAKQMTRTRLLDAARAILLSDGEEAVSASAVARAAGVANATFYEHFANKQELLRTLAEELFTRLRVELRAPRWEAIQEPSSEEKLRRLFRVPLEMLIADPRLLRLSLRMRHQPRSAFGEVGGRLAGGTRRDLVRELMDRGYPASTPRQRRRLEMIADVHTAAVETLALGHVNGRYPDVEEIVDMLVLVTRGTRLVRDLGRAEAEGSLVSAEGP